MRRILFIHDSYFLKDSEDRFYSIHVTDKVISRYLRLGDQLTFIGRVRKVENEEMSRYSKLDKNIIEVIELPNIKSVVGYLKNRSLVEKKIRDAVHSHDIIVPRIASTLGAIGLKYALKESKPVLGEVVSCNWDALWNYGFKGKLLAPYYFFKQRRVVKKLPYAIYVTEEFLQNRYPTTGKSIGCSDVSLKLFDSRVLEKRMSYLKKDFDINKLRIGTVAALNVPYKGQRYVIQALKKIKNIDKYLLVGAGDPKNLVKVIENEKMDNYVDIVGPLAHDKIFDFLDSLDVYIQPSKQEGLPRAVVEAMSRGLLVVGSRTGGIPELIEDRFVFNKGKIGEISRILNNLEISDFMEQGQKNFEKAEQYQEMVLESKRNNFFKSFLSENFD